MIGSDFQRTMSAIGSFFSFGSTAETNSENTEDIDEELASLKLDLRFETRNDNSAIQRLDAIVSRKGSRAIKAAEIIKNYSQKKATREAFGTNVGTTSSTASLSPDTASTCVNNTAKYLLLNRNAIDAKDKIIGAMCAETIAKIAENVPITKTTVNSNKNAIRPLSTPINLNVQRFSSTCRQSYEMAIRSQAFSGFVDEDRLKDAYHKRAENPRYGVQAARELIKLYQTKYPNILHGRPPISIDELCSEGMRCLTAVVVPNSYDIEFLELAAKYGDPTAQLYLGKYRVGEFRSRSYFCSRSSTFDNGIFNLKKAMEKGNPEIAGEAAFVLAKLLEDSFYHESSSDSFSNDRFSKSLECYKYAADLGHSGAIEKMRSISTWEISILELRISKDSATNEWPDFDIIQNDIDRLKEMSDDKDKEIADKATRVLQRYDQDRGPQPQKYFFGLITFGAEIKRKEFTQKHLDHTEKAISSVESSTASSTTNVEKKVEATVELNQVEPPTKNFFDNWPWSATTTRNNNSNSSDDIYSL